MRRATDVVAKSPGVAACRSASGRHLSFVTVCDFSRLASCYAELNGRLRPEAETKQTDNEF